MAKIDVKQSVDSMLHDIEHLEQELKGHEATRAALDKREKEVIARIGELHARVHEKIHGATAQTPAAPEAQNAPEVKTAARDEPTAS